MDSQMTNIRKVAVIGAGVSGVAAAIHLKKAGLNVTVFERTDRAGGVWVFNERKPEEPQYPSIRPSVGDCDDEILEQVIARQGKPVANEAEAILASQELERLHAPPAAAYQGLKNNVSTVEMEMQSHAWKPGTEEFVPHHDLAEYISDAAAANGVLPDIQFRTRVSKLSKTDGSWVVDLIRLKTATTGDELGRNDSHLDLREPVDQQSGAQLQQSQEVFDAVVIAVGHYHACNVPDMPGLSAWKAAYPERIFHSKGYRHPEEFRGKNVLLVGAGVSSTDIAKEISPMAKNVYQVSRGGQYDIPASFLPPSVYRIGPIQSFDTLDSDAKSAEGGIPGTVTLASGQRLCNLDTVILCTGYHVSLPFLRDYHADGVRSEDADDRVLVTDGQQTHNLHKDIFYIEDPTLSFVGVPYHVATFSLFEFQAMALAAVWSGRASLPSREEMRAEYRARIQRKGAGRTFHSLKAEGDEIAYVNELVKMVNGHDRSQTWMTGHSERWHKAYQVRLKRLKAMKLGTYVGTTTSRPEMQILCP
ncbi:Thiol-specific monooxygenase [Elsinoe australis]|uniref:Thiol-specific monooxygenase n=1 Tax=Elsinoe australis TaxID=40998 RepID=A0A2P7Z1E3_9PEZI|nr:Thiol-specific monooxygenase [Elsinoe australis]